MESTPASMVWRLLDCTLLASNGLVVVQPENARPSARTDPGVLYMNVRLNTILSWLADDVSTLRQRDYRCGTTA